MAGRALHVVRVQRVVNTCWLFPRVLAGFLLGTRQMGERAASERHVERGRESGRAVTEVRHSISR